MVGCVGTGAGRADEMGSFSRSLKSPTSPNGDDRDMAAGQGWAGRLGKSFAITSHHKMLGYLLLSQIQNKWRLFIKIKSTQSSHIKTFKILSSGRGREAKRKAKRTQNHLKNHKIDEMNSPPSSSCSSAALA